MGVPVGTARLAFSFDASRSSLWRGVALVQTNRAADAIYKMRDRLCEDFDAFSLEPRLMEITQRENRVRNQYTVTFSDSSSDSSGRIQTLRRSRRGAQRQQFRLKNAFGPISAGLKILSQPLEVGQRRSVLVFTGTSYYLVELSVVRRERLASALGNIEAFLTNARIVRSSEGSAAASVHNVAVWISAQGEHLPLRAEAMTFIGPVTADLAFVGQHAFRRAAGSRGATGGEDEGVAIAPARQQQSGQGALTGAPLP